MIKVAINGFGRIGRAAFKIALEHKDIEVVAINDLGDPANLAYLLKHDTVYGRYQPEVRVTKNNLRVGAKTMKILNEADPENLPWQDLGIDVVIESTGVFTDKTGAGKHLTAGARFVIISAPTKSLDVATVVLGVNNQDIAGQKIISNASCTTNCAAPIVTVLDTVFGVEKALLTTVHSYTASQSLVDGPAKDRREGRAAAQNIIPTSTGAATAATKAYTPLAYKFDGVSLRVPTPIVSISDVVALLKEDVTVDEINQAFREAASNPLYSGVIGISEEEAVSSDFIGDSRSAIVDVAMTRVVAGNLVKVMAWYDNEWGYSTRLVEQVIALAGGEK